jgi:hypothetical protein
MSAVRAAMPASDFSHGRTVHPAKSPKTTKKKKVWIPDAGERVDGHEPSIACSLRTGEHMGQILRKRFPAKMLLFHETGWQDRMITKPSKRDLCRARIELATHGSSVRRSSV